MNSILNDVYSLYFKNFSFFLNKKKEVLIFFIFSEILFLIWSKIKYPTKDIFDEDIIASFCFCFIDLVGFSLMYTGVQVCNFYALAVAVFVFNLMIVVASLVNVFDEKKKQPFFLAFLFSSTFKCISAIKWNNYIYMFEYFFKNFELNIFLNYFLQELIFISLCLILTIYTKMFLLYKYPTT